MHVPQRERFLVFRDFVLQTFPRDYLESGVILDVAGGKGDLSWIFTNADNLEAVVVDPRPTDHRKIVRTAEWHWEHRMEDAALLAEARGPQGMLRDMSLRPPFRAARHLQVPLDDRLLGALPAGSDNDIVEWSRFWAEALAAAGPPAEELAGTPSTSSCRVEDAAEACRMFTAARLILGFHPDQATDYCVDLALRSRIPFVVCPCCVFPAQFPARRLAGQRVKTYEDYIAFLRAKHPGIRAVQLPFDQQDGCARNVALYMTATDFGERTESVDIDGDFECENGAAG